MGFLRAFWASITSALPKAAPPPNEHLAFTRAKQALKWQDVALTAGKAVTYGMGFGGKDPKAPHPFEWDPKTKAWRCDCSGLVAWCHGYSRLFKAKVTKTDANGRVTVDEVEFWRNTDGLEKDARGVVPGDLGDGVPWGSEKEGDVLVAGLGTAVGHTGISDGKGKAIHCHSGHPTIVYTSDRWWRSKKDLKVNGAFILRVAA